MSDATASGFLLVIGRFDLETPEGKILRVTPAPQAIEAADAAEDRVHLVGRNDTGKTLFDRAVTPLRNSCAPRATKGLFQEYVPATDDLSNIEISIDGAPLDNFSRPPAAAWRPSAFTVEAAAKPNRLRLAAEAGGPPAGSSFAVQARPAGTTRWFTLAVGLERSDAEVDINQFPEAEAIEMRVLQSDGFSETEVFKTTRRLSQ